MALQNSGPISLSQIASEFSDSPPHKLSEFHGAAAGLPPSGAISLQDFYGVASALELSITTDTQELNVRTLALANGWDGDQLVILTIESGVYVYSNDTAVAALDMGGTYPQGLQLINKGYIMGKGGQGGDGTQITSQNPSDYEPEDGGPAIKLTDDIEIDNSQGYIGGGGGGGAINKHLATNFATSMGTGTQVTPENYTVAGGGGAGGGRGGATYYTNGQSNLLSNNRPNVPSPGAKGGSWIKDDAYIVSNCDYYISRASGTNGGGASGLILRMTV